MTAFTDAEIDAATSGEFVSVAAAFRAELNSETVYYAEHLTGYTDVNGVEWGRIGEGIVSFDDVAFTSGVVAPKRTYNLEAGTMSSLAMSMVGDETEYRWRPITQFLQFFDDAGQPLGSPIHVHTGLMDHLTFSLSPAGFAKLAMTTETHFVKKNLSTSGYYTDTDQQSRHPSDKGLERVKLLSLGEAVKWPDF